VTVYLNDWNAGDPVPTGTYAYRDDLSPFDLRQGKVEAVAPRDDNLRQLIRRTAGERPNRGPVLIHEYLDFTGVTVTQAEVYGALYGL
jgi:hypothetical protein